MGRRTDNGRVQEMKRARLILTWDELLRVRSGLESERDYLTRRLAEMEDDRSYPAIRKHLAEQIAIVEALLPRVEKAIERT